MTTRISRQFRAFLVCLLAPLVFASLFAGFSTSALAQSGPVEMDDSAPLPPPVKVKSNGSVVGRKAAEKYMAPHDPQPRSSGREVGSQLDSTDHYFAVHLGSFVSDNAYSWGSNANQSNVGHLTAGITYRIGEWYHSMDLVFRADYAVFNLDDGGAGKISLLPMITFPDASSRFPLYLGAGAGLGIFTRQIDQKSSLSIDYQVVLGARFFEVLNNTGFFIEAGLKNSIFLLTSGQFNGTFVAVGPVFTF